MLKSALLSVHKGEEVTLDLRGRCETHRGITLTHTVYLSVRPPLATFPDDPGGSDGVETTLMETCSREWDVF